jgi:acetolactate decarboxylase
VSRIKWHTRRVLDERLISNLHVHALSRTEAHADRDPGVLFQVSTIAALLDGAYEGDLSFGELAEHGDLGLGTVNGLDGEMIALDGDFYRADVDGFVHALAPSDRTPFAVVVRFEAALEVELGAGDLEALVDAHLDAPAAALRVDGEFELVRARSVPRQEPPYRPLAEVAVEQHVFELAEVGGSVVGFRFPDYAAGVEVSGHHLHFITADRGRGGHVLGCRLRRGRLRIDPSADLHVELPPGVELGEGHVDEAALDRIERAH